MQLGSKVAGVNQLKQSSQGYSTTRDHCYLREGSPAQQQTKRSVGATHGGHRYVVVVFCIGLLGHVPAVSATVRELVKAEEGAPRAAEASVCHAGTC